MEKVVEMADPFSCINKAEDDEPIFVLLARDRMAPKVVRAWVHEARAHGEKDEEKLAEATACAYAMEQWRLKHRPVNNGPNTDGPVRDRRRQSPQIPASSTDTGSGSR